MPEEYEVGTERAQELIDERREERAEREARPRWLDLLAVSTALFAVLAAVAALQAGDKANEALLTANRAVLAQTQAVDSWLEFQADSLKKGQQQALGVLLPHVGGSAAEISATVKEAQRRQKMQDTLQLASKMRDARTETLDRESDRLLERHQQFALSVTLFQVAIGLSAIAALLRRPPVWWVSLGAGVAGALFLARGLV